MDYEQIKDLYSTFIIQRTYTRFDDKLGRRETWEEAVERYANFLTKQVPLSLIDTFNEAIQAIKEKKVMPSMRLLWTAGRAAEHDPVCAYNCGFIAVTDIKVFSEMMYLLMNGVGVGFSVERQFICKLPEVSAEQYPDQAQCYTVEDSKEGWALTYKSLIRDWYHGIPSTWNVSKVRPKGTPIKGFGGRASGPEVLVDLFNFTKNTIYYASGRKLNSKELADIICKIADIVIAGGVRRSATICLSNLSDQRMKHFKDGQFWLENPQRALANISVAYTEKPDVIAFMEEMRALIVSNSGERGLINVEAFPDESMRSNPCGERILRSRQLCNLTEVVVDSGITFEELSRRIKLATFLGTVQTTLTEFNTKVLSKDWIKNTKEDAMLGVSLTGVSNITWYPNDLEKLQDLARHLNREYAKVLGINPAYGITCNKPSGTVSQVVGVPSGIHPDYAPFYIRRVRVSKADPICTLLVDSGVPYHPEVGSTLENATTYVFEWPTKSTSLRVRNNCSALEQLRYYKLFKKYWCDERGNPSCTIYIKDNEWIEVINWIFSNWDYIGGLSFLPYSTGVYQLTPYEEITEDKFNELCEKFPHVDFSKLGEYEREDRTEGAKEFACQGGSCELI